MWFELLDLVVRGSDIIHVIYRIVADNAVKLRFLKHIVSIITDSDYFLRNYTFLLPSLL